MFKKITLFSFILWANHAMHLCAQPIDSLLASKMQNTIDSMRLATNLKGISACVLYPGKGMWEGVSGISHNGQPIATGMLFGIGSNTKLFTGVLLLKLAQNNVIRLDDSIYKYLPTYNYINPHITIRQLLNHTSGLFDIISTPGYMDSILSNPNRLYTPAELMSWLGPPLFAPGKGWNYCNTNYILAGMIAEAATGKSYGKLLRDSILSPLKLDSTFLDVFETVLYPVAHPWQGANDNFGVPRKALNSAAWSAGAMYSTAAQMTKWYESLMGGKVLSPAYFKELTTFVGQGKYGMGIIESIVNGRTVWQHAGTIWGGYNSSMMYDTATGIIICVLINQLPAQAYQISSQLLLATISQTVGITEALNTSFKIDIYPNPTSCVLYIDISGQKLQSAELYNMQGKRINVFNQSLLPVEELSAGVYYLVINTNGGSVVKKFIKQ
jgi:D-alanyl-D-alanine carboxypeptidase